MNTTTDSLIDQADGSYKALLAAEIAQKTGRQNGPIDGKCEVCGDAADSFTLQDWKSWHCFKCVVASLEAEGLTTSDAQSVVEAAQR